MTFEDGLDVAVRHGAFDDEGLRRSGEGFVAEDAAQQVDLFGGRGGEVGQGALADAAAYALALAEEDGGPRVAVRDAFDVHGNIVLPKIGHRNRLSREMRTCEGCVYIGTRCERCSAVKALFHKDFMA